MLGRDVMIVYNNQQQLTTCRLCSFQEDFVVLQSLLRNNGNQGQQAIIHCNIWIKIIQVAIQIECLHGMEFLDPDDDLYCDLNNFPPRKSGIICHSLSLLLLAGHCDLQFQQPLFHLPVFLLQRPSLITRIMDVSATGLDKSNTYIS